MELTNFNLQNFDCPCCGSNKMKDRFLFKLQATRYKANIPFIIDSGFRCPKHNVDVGGKPTSDHLTGEAADIKCVDSRSRFLILRAAFDIGFVRIGIGKTFIHLGDNPNNPQEVLWLY